MWSEPYSLHSQRLIAREYCERVVEGLDSIIDSREKMAVKVSVIGEDVGVFYFLFKYINN